MKTTVDIPDALLNELRRRSRTERTTLRALIHAALRQFLASSRRPAGRFALKDGSVDGRGPAPGVREGEWAGVRGAIYEGRGG